MVLTQRESDSACKSAKNDKQKKKENNGHFKRFEKRRPKNGQCCQKRDDKSTYGAVY